MLNRCPSCQASVLDDDADVCPFCGSPMDPAKAKGYAPSGLAAQPTAVKAASSAAASKPASPKPSSPERSTEPRPKPTPKSASPKTAAAAAASDDPFGVDVGVGSSAIQLSPKRTQQRPNKVVCPMCDTVGFAPDAASGKEVRCANEKCLVPVFTAPDFAAPPPAEPEPQPSSLVPTLLTFGTVALILIAGASVWWFVLRKPEPSTPAGPIAVTPVTPAVETPGNSDPAPTPEVEQPVTPAPPSPAETIATVMQRWTDVQDDITQPAQQPLRRRYAAESHSLAGQVEAARAQIARLESLRSADPFYRIAPLAYLAWSELANGNEAGAKKSIEASAPLLDTIPRQGFDPARIVIDWSAAAARFGEESRARELVRVPRDDAEGEQLLALLKSASVFSEDDLDAEYALRPIVPWAQPKSTAATLSLLDRAAFDTARAWAAGSPDASSRAENLAAWAEAVSLDATLDPAGSAAKVREAVSSSSPAERALVAARAAVRAASLDRKTTAEALFALATEAAGQLNAGEQGSAADLAEFARYELPDQTAVRLAAVALGETAHAAALLGKTEGAQGFLAKALDGLQAAAPPEAAVAERASELKSLGISGVRSRLKQALGLNSDSDAESAANAYRRKVDEANRAVAARSELQSQLLARSVAWNLGEFVLAEAQRRSSEEGGSAKLLSGASGGRLIAAFEKAGDRESADAVRAAGATNRDVPALPAIELTLESFLAGGKATEAARELYASHWNAVSSSEKIGIGIRAACRLDREKSAAAAFDFAKAISDGNDRQEILRYLSASAAQSGHGAEIVGLMAKSRLSSTEQAAVLRGLTEGLVDAEATADSSVTAASSGKP